MLPLVDGDILAYRIGFASQDVSEKLCLARFDEFIVDMLLFGLDHEGDFKGYLTLDSKDNFRHNIAKTVPYKGNRTNSKPIHYDLLRSYMMDTWEFEGVTGEEADDAIAREATRLGDEAIICSIDKDLDQVAGWHYNFVKRIKYHVTADQGFRSFCLQVLTGDRTDNIIGLRGIGPVNANRILGEADSVQSQWRSVYEAYREAGDSDLKRFSENCKLLWLRRKPKGQVELIDELLEALDTGNVTA